MSNFNSIKSMWESKAKQTVVKPPVDNSRNTTIPTNSNPPPNNINPVRNTTNPNPSNTSVTFTEPAKKPKNIQEPVIIPPKKQQPQIKPTTNTTPQMSRQTVAQLKQNLQVLFNKPATGLNRTNPTISNPPAKMQQNSNNLQQPKKEGQQRTPTYIQSKANLQQIFQRKKFQPQGYHTGGVSDINYQSYIDLKKSQSIQELTPEERTQQIMNRIFSNPEKTPSNKGFLLEQIETKKQVSQPNQSLTILSSQEKVSSLILRSGKKQRLNLGSFDDA